MEGHSGMKNHTKLLMLPSLPSIQNINYEIVVFSHVILPMENATRMASPERSRRRLVLPPLNEWLVTMHLKW